MLPQLKQRLDATTSSSAEVQALGFEEEINTNSGGTSHIQKAHPPQEIIGNLNERVTRFSRSAHLSCFTNTLFVALFEPWHVGHALSDSSWFNVMHEKLENFERNQVWNLVEPPPNVNVTGIKWVFKNKHGEHVEVVRNKARLVMQDFD
jgi:hypothetical protein